MSRRAAVNKHGARRAEVDGIGFASRAEARRYRELLLLERAGEIVRLELQPEYPLEVNGVKLGAYRGDFRYSLAEEPTVPVVEDVKGKFAPLDGRRKRRRALPGEVLKRRWNPKSQPEYRLWRIQTALVKALYGIEVRIVK